MVTCACPQAPGPSASSNMASEYGKQEESRTDAKAAKELEKMVSKMDDTEH